MSQSNAAFAPEPSTANQARMLALLEDARRRLVETGTRNRLVHVNRDNKRANALNIINERSDDLYAILRSRKRKMRFKAMAPDEPEATAEEGGLPLLTDFENDEPFDEARYTDDLIETPLTTDKLQKRLLRLSRDAKSAEEEQGVNILYLALGFLTWFEDKKSAVPRHAPLVLLPVELVRNARTATFDLVCRDDDMVTNLPLQERLRTDFGIELPEIEEGEDWTPERYFDEIAPIIEERESWALDRNGVQLGFFSFAKLLMLRDLDPANWPNGKLLDHDVLDGLMVSGFEPEAPLFGPEDRLDEQLEPADIIQVVDADASQTKVIEEVRAGRNLVVQGPPGTGKSQTITNMIAAAVHDGKTVLFVAEKMAALDVVHSRLKKSGLSATCLELHSRSANKKAVLGELSRTLNMSASVPSMPAPPDDLKRYRDTLNAVSDLLHTAVPGHDFTPFDALAEIVGYVGRGAPPPGLASAPLAEISNSDAQEICERIEDYTAVVETAGKRAEHPFAGTINLTLQPTDIQRLVPKLENAAEQMGELVRKTGSLATTLGVPGPSTLGEVSEFAAMLTAISAAPPQARNFIGLVAGVDKIDRFAEALELGMAWVGAKSSAEAAFVEAAWASDTAALRGPILAGASSFFARVGGKYRAASRQLASVLSEPIPKSAAARLELIDTLMDVQSKQRAALGEEDFLKRVLAEEWRGERTPFERIIAVLEWYLEFQANRFAPAVEVIEKVLGDQARLQKLAGALQSRAQAVVLSLTDLDATLRPSLSGEDEANWQEKDLAGETRKVANMASSIGRYGEWVRLCQTFKALSEAGLGELADKIESGDVSASDASREFRYARAEAQWTMARSQFPKLDRLTTLQRHRLVEEYRAHEAERIEDTQRLVLSKHLQQLPRGAVGEMAFIRGEIGKKRAHKPIRKMIQTAGRMIQRIKPVFLMSPISVAQFLPPGSVHFDLLVIDEASQVRPEDALGVVARSGQIVVVGDQKQLPPTSFFDRMTGNTETDEEGEDVLGGAARATELESILSLCEARGLNRQMLEWHYRSRDPSLIRVSNVEFYDSNLVLPPSPLQLDESYGLKFNRVNGAYSSTTKGTGRPGTNQIEAKAVVDAIALHARDHAELSLGVVAFSVRQRDILTELLEHARRQDEVLDSFLREGKSEDVFVKNIENVQGDERDVIFISVGYGPNEPGGRLASMSFGPVNGEGGERRLNVLFSRSRIRCEVFASFDPGDIDLARTTKEGPRVFKRFLDFAKTGQIDEKVATGFLADSPFEADVADQVRKLGFDVDHQVGSSGFLIDLGVKHPDRPGQYMLAIECDGATYHSALWARERDRLRQAVLENLGWRFHRIWSTDWFHRRSEEIGRLRDALALAAEESRSGVAVEGANKGSDAPHESQAADSEDHDLGFAIETEPISIPPYTKFTKQVRTTYEPHEVPVAQLKPLIAAIIEIEGPIHTEEVARRLAFAFGKDRTGQRIRDAAERALQAAHMDDEIDVQSAGDFWHTAQQSAVPPVRDRSEQDGAILKADMLAPSEVIAAAKIIKEQSGEVAKDDLVRATARLLGFKRVGTELRARISEVID